jgi:tetratricopeptide (TPR) repeat protein
MSVEENFSVSQIKSLNEAGLFGSAQILGNFFDIYSSEETTLELGNSLYGAQDYRRALQTYMQGLQKIATKTAGQDPKQLGPSPIEIQFKMKIGDCHMKLKNLKLAHQTFISIPSSHRTVYVNMCLAQISQVYDQKKNAILYYKEVLKQYPFSLEAIEALLELGGSATELQHIISDHLNNEKENRRQQAQEHGNDGVKTLFDYIDAYAEYAKCDFERAVQLFTKMKYSHNCHLLKTIAMCFYRTNNVEKAQKSFERIRALDKTFISTMDYYALLLKNTGAITELNKLTQELLAVNPQSPETWTAIGMYCEMKGKPDHALIYYDRAISLSPRHPLANEMKGWRCLALGKSREAMEWFKNAQIGSQKRDLGPYRGLIEVCLLSKLPKDALQLAMDANQIHVNTAQSMALLGLAFAADSNQRTKAREMFDKALKLNPSCIDAILGSANMLRDDNQHNNAVTLLEQYCDQIKSDVLHTALAELFVQLTKYDEAMHHYSAALEINPYYPPARDGHKQLDTALKSQGTAMEDEEQYDDQEEEFEGEDS